MTPTACSFTPLGSCQQQPQHYNELITNGPTTDYYDDCTGSNNRLAQLLIMNTVDSALSETSTQFQTLRSSPVDRGSSSCNNKMADSPSLLTLTLAKPNTILELQSTVDFLKTKLQQAESQVKMLHDQNHQLRLLFENHLILEPKNEDNGESDSSSPEDTAKILALLQRSESNASGEDKEVTPSITRLQTLFTLDDAVHVIKNKQRDQVQQLLTQQTEMQKRMTQLEDQNKVQAETIASMKENFTICTKQHEQDPKQALPQQKEQMKLKQRRRPKLTIKTQESCGSSRWDKADSRLDKVASSASTILLSLLSSTGRKASQQALDKRQQKKQRPEEKPLEQQPKPKQPQWKQEQLQQNPVSTNTEFSGPSAKDILFSLRTMAVERLNSLNMQQQPPYCNETESNFIVKEIPSSIKSFQDNLAYNGNKKGRTINKPGKQLSVPTIVIKEIHCETRTRSLPEFQSTRVVL